MKVLFGSEKPGGVNKIQSFLEKEGFSVEFVLTPSSVLEKISFFEYDCILLDHNVLGEATFIIIDKVAKLDKVDGVIIISKDLSPEKTARALDMGADDVMTEPINSNVLVARIRAIIRRKKFQAKSKIYIGNLVVDIFSKTVCVWSNEVTLTRKEFEILLFLISNRDKVVSKVTLSEYLWGESANDFDTFDSLFTHIKNLRKKLKEAKAEVEFKSIYGVGYQIIEI